MKSFAFKMSLFVESQRGKKILYLEGFFYIKDRVKDDTTYWKCERSKIGCKGRLVRRNETTIKRAEHNHEGRPEKVEVRKVLQAVREGAQKTVNIPQVILSEATGSCSEITSANLPSIPSMKRTIRNIRNKDNNFPSIPNEASSLILPEDFKITDKGKHFLLFDSGVDDTDRILIFGTNENIQHLYFSPYWYMDGTFKTVPKLFQQLFTIHGKVGNIVVPLVYILLLNKLEATYVRAIKQVKLLTCTFGQCLMLTHVVIDFENGLISAIQKLFPNIQIQGCFFHFKQCIYRKLQKFGLKQEYDTDCDFANKVKLLEALAFLPVNHVHRGFDIILEQTNFPPKMQKLIDYFEETWVGRMERRARKKPRFQIEIWNCYHSIIENMHITNNIVEGWHHGFLLMMNSEKPSIWNFLSTLKKEQSLTDLKIINESTGVRPKKKTYKSINIRIKKICEDFNDNSDLEIENYLKSVSLIL